MSENIQILIIDDEQIILDSVCKHLRSMDYSLFTAFSAIEAKQVIAGNNINIILTDLMMPEMDGLELLRYVKENNRNIIVIMITGYATINTALQAMHLGAFDYIAKPFTRDELQKVVKRASAVASAAMQSLNSEKTTDQEKEPDKIMSMKGIGKYTWVVRQDDGTILLGVERPFLYSIGKIQTVYLPSKGDIVRQGAVYFQAFSSDLRAHSLLSPLSGTVIDVNQSVVENPVQALEDPYGEGWLMRLAPSDFEDEIKIIGY